VFFPGNQAAESHAHERFIIGNHDFIHLQDP
jgi:hypothetical protein